MVGWTLPLLLLTMLLQVFSHATTCNQGSIDAYWLGATRTLPMLLIVGAVLAGSLLRLRRYNRSWLLIVSIVGIVILITVVWLNSDIWIGAIWYGTPCFGFRAFPGAHVAPMERAVIAFAYLVLPVANIVLYACVGARGFQQQEG